MYWKIKMAGCILDTLLTYGKGSGNIIASGLFRPKPMHHEDLYTMKHILMNMMQTVESAILKRIKAVKLSDAC